MRTIDEVLRIEDIDQKIAYLKKGRKTELPDAVKLYNDWNPNRHEIITDTEKYPKIKITVEKEKEVYDEKTGKTTTIPKKTKDVEPNRIALPIEQDIVNIQTAFTVGTEPKMNCEPEENEQGLFSALRKVLEKNKIKYQNKRIVRSWLSEQECAEYWYVVKDDGFWAKLKRKIGTLFGASAPEYRLNSVIWSPFRGDKLYPFFDDSNNLVAFSREYKKKDLDDVEITCFMTITADSVYQWEFIDGWKSVSSFKHGFKKLPVLYCYRPEAYCEKIKTLRVRLEKLLSNYADCIDYHFFPILMLFGDVQNFSGEFKSRVVELTGQGANAQYLTWNQVPTTVQYEAETLINQIYALTNTPRISFDAIKGSGNVLSGVAFDYVFLSTHLNVENLAEVIGEFMQRRVNFLVSALGSINSSLEKAAETIDINVEIEPYRLENLSEKIDTALKAKNGELWSQQRAITFVGNIDNVLDEVEQIKEEQAEKQQNEISKQEKLSKFSSKSNQPVK
ncbi:phage portal protein, SPP1 family [Paraprevotella xylaniphila YIT 11841]|uniref:Phage portal protein, SPP1 family n=2 Tax=root TaxID=1 RepID=F3QSL4_9BACT|nr:phage portal protein [Paraprevotella xylaniphila]EGG55301.1 phage portal protein, SPP1 family [Paraprevotella xylaniphila YIT 11841]DAE17947.1 MAG TPA: portal protein [Siphoviridae sp. ctr8v12]